MSQGTVVTFYSFKGGVGRSFLLANVATALTSWGYRVLCVDWDLEAPGLHRYFQPWVKGKPKPGLIDLILALNARKKLSWRKYVTRIKLPRIKQPISFIPAGFSAEDYVGKVQNLDWGKMYKKANLGWHLEKLRNDWMKTFDYILIDSRTGITDIGGICTVQLPDILVLQFSANNQSLDGAADIAQRAIEQRKSLPFDRSKLLVLPIPSRFDMREELKLGEQWLKTFEKTLAPFYSNWLHRTVPLARLLAYIYIPYFSYWSFGEKLPILQEKTKGPESLTYPLETVSALIAHELSKTDLLVESRDLFVSSARKGLRRPSVRKGLPSIYLSYSHNDKPFVDTLRRLLLSRGFAVGGVAAVKRVEWVKSLGLVYNQIQDSDFALFFVGANPSSFEIHQANFMAKASLEGKTRFMPVLLKGSRVAHLSHRLGFYSFSWALDARRMSVEDLASKIESIVRTREKKPRFA